MSTKRETMITKDAVNKKLTVVREFDGSLQDVWNAWTQQELLDQWWAPSPWRTKTKSLDFKEGGTWLYAMEGPEGEQHWCRADYQKIIPGKFYSGDDAFCDEDGNVTNVAPSMHWEVAFASEGSGTKVTVNITFASEEDLEKIIEMGFKEGFTAAHGNLDKLLAGGLNQS